MKKALILGFLSMVVAASALRAEEKTGYASYVSVAVVSQENAEEIGRSLAKANIRAVISGADAQVIAVAPESEKATVALLKRNFAQKIQEMRVVGQVATR